MTPLPPPQVEWVDVRPHLVNGIQPVHLFERPLLHGSKPKGGLFSVAEVARVGEFWVPQTSVIEPNTKWALCRDGQFVRVPITAYRTSQRAASSILLAGLHTGMAAMHDLRNHTATVPLGVMLVLGHECTDLGTEHGYRCYIGIAIQTK